MFRQLPEGGLVVSSHLELIVLFVVVFLFVPSFSRAPRDVLRLLASLLQNCADYPLSYFSSFLPDSGSTTQPFDSSDSTTGQVKAQHCSRYHCDGRESTQILLLNGFFPFPCWYNQSQFSCREENAAQRVAAANAHVAHFVRAQQSVETSCGVSSNCLVNGFKSDVSFLPIAFQTRGCEDRKSVV